MKSSSNKALVSIGCCCGPAIHMRALGINGETYPLDWFCSYHDVYKIFENEFSGFLKTTKHTSLRNKEIGFPPDQELEYNLEYSVRIFHREYEEGRGKSYEETIQRRIDRLKKLLSSGTSEVIFIRRSHMPLHHTEVAISPLRPIEDSIGEKEDMEMLVKVIRRKYPNLKFKIHLFIDCNCRNYTESDSQYLRVKIIPGDLSECSFRNELLQL